MAAAPRQSKDDANRHHEEAAYLRDIVLVTKGQNVDIPNGRGPLPIDEVARVIGRTDACDQPVPGDENDSDVRVAAEVVKIVDVYQIGRGDPLSVVESLPARSGATVVHVLAPSTHWGFEPGEPPQPFPTHLRRPKIPSKTERIKNTVAVVDTGFVPTGIGGIDKLTQWDVVDKDTDGGGHGTFITSIVRQLAPATGVSIARAQSVAHSDTAGRSIPPNAGVTSELHVFKAILRLLDRHGKDDAIAALNLSLGTYPIEVDNPLPLLTKVLPRWRRRFRSPIFAAAGNDDVADRFWPANIGGVIGVEPLDVDGDTTAWDENLRRVAPPRQRQPYDRVAPGVDLVGVRGRGPKNVVVWSGASFATPVVAALTARNGALPAKTTLEYGDVKRLVYLDRRPSLVQNP